MAAPTTRPAERLTHPEKQLFESGLKLGPDEVLRRHERDGDPMARRGASPASRAATR